MVRWAMVGLGLLVGCGSAHEPDGGIGFPDTGAVDAGEVDGGADGGPEACSCTLGSHNDLVYLMSDRGELWSFDPVTLEFAFVVGPVCGGMTPFSMAVDAHGIAFVNFVESLAIETFDVNDPGPCEDSGYLRRNPDFGLLGMSFASNSATDICADLYVHTYDGDGPFEEGPGLGKLGVIDRETLELRELAVVDYDGGELTGTGDGRLFAFAGERPVKLVEYERTTGSPLETIPLTGFRKTHSSAAAFHSGDIYVFIEAVPAECEPCLEATCSADLAACRADATCADDLECVVTDADFRDDCGGFLPSPVVDCVTACPSCLTLPRNRVSRVLRFDLDDSEGGGRIATEVVSHGPVRVVGAASSPCVQTIPF